MTVFRKFSSPRDAAIAMRYANRLGWASRQVPFSNDLVGANESIRNAMGNATRVSPGGASVRTVRFRDGSGAVWVRSVPSIAFPPSAVVRAVAEEYTPVATLHDTTTIDEILNPSEKPWSSGLIVNGDASGTTPSPWEPETIDWDYVLDICTIGDVRCFYAYAEADHNITQVERGYFYQEVPVSSGYTYQLSFQMLFPEYYPSFTAGGNFYTLDVLKVTHSVYKKNYYGAEPSEYFNELESEDPKIEISSSGDPEIANLASMPESNFGEGSGWQSATVTFMAKSKIATIRLGMQDGGTIGYGRLRGYIGITKVSLSKV